MWDAMPNPWPCDASEASILSTNGGGFAACGMSPVRDGPPFQHHGVEERRSRWQRIVCRHLGLKSLIHTELQHR
jgi:hypothetical protein